ncbi:MAG: hypothetical protein IJ758_03810 [Clostridia bacterium]|nr:hypothetical protein [Clostridia bacterium]
MSRNSVGEFYLNVKKNIELREKLETLKKRLEEEKNKISLNDLKQKIITLAHESGYNFTATDLDEYLEQIKEQLTEEELVQINAGLSKRLAILGLSGALLMSLGTGAAINMGLKEFDKAYVQKIEKDSHRKEAIKRKDKTEKSRKNSKENENKNSAGIFKPGAK